MNDNIFDSLTYDFIWETTTNLTLFGENYSVTLGIEDGEEIGITQIQKNSYYSLINNTNNIISEIENSIFQYYKKICDTEPESIDSNVRDTLPNITDVHDMKQLVKPTNLCIPELDEDEEISILFDCIWDFNLGMGIKIVNNKIIHVGVQNDVL